MTNEDQLREKLRRIEALFAGATTEGERLAAAGLEARARSRASADHQRTRCRCRVPVESRTVSRA